MSRTANDTLLDQGPVDWASPWTSMEIPLNFLTMYSIRLEFIGFPSGRLYLECSNDFKDNLDNWTVINGSDQVVTEAGDHTWEVRSAPYMKVRVRWEPNAGAATLIYAQFTAKGGS